MKLVFFCHPDFMNSQSMPRYAQMLAQGMQKRGHFVSLWRPKPYFSLLPVPKKMRKWLGYIDQFVIFPIWVKLQAKKCTPDTLFVFTDHALGPWVPLVVHQPHIIHCHDFLAQRAALGNFPGQHIGRTGKVYQRLIRKGYTRGSHFISVSEKTQADLHQLLPQAPRFSEVVYNGLNRSFLLMPAKDARATVGHHLHLDLQMGYLLHVGGNQWYKNRQGVISLYEAWRNNHKGQLPLLLIGEAPDAALLLAKSNSDYGNDIHFVEGSSDQWVNTAYCGAALFLFPSIAEGFGWPIIEAMACGCLVATTRAEPMTEVGANAAFYFEPAPESASGFPFWAINGAKLINDILHLPDAAKASRVELGLQHAQTFNTNTALNKIERIYKQVSTKQSSIKKVVQS